MMAFQLKKPSVLPGFGLTMGFHASVLVARGANSPGRAAAANHDDGLVAVRRRVTAPQVWLPIV